jgi:uncharacterized protein (DUF488 family)
MFLVELLNLTFERKLTAAGTQMSNSKAPRDSQPEINQDLALAAFYTIGHSNRSIEAFLSLLSHAGVALLIDVRALPRSRFNPQFNSAALALSLRAAGIGYRYLPALGGLREGQPDGWVSPNSFWQNEHFRNFADYTATAEFRQGFGELLRLGRAQICAIMCAEADWRQCHRQIIADYLLASGETVTHIGKEGGLEEGRLNQAAVYGADGVMTYPAAQGRLF